MEFTRYTPVNKVWESAVEAAPKPPPEPVKEGWQINLSIDTNDYDCSNGFHKATYENFAYIKLGPFYITWGRGQ